MDEPVKKPRKKTKSPTARTLEWLRKTGYIAGVVERRLPHCFTTTDLFGFIDIVAVGGGEKGCLGVQATSGSNLASRIAKTLAEPRAKTWVEAGNRVMLIGWRKLASSNRWEPNIRMLNIGDFTENDP